MRDKGLSLVTQSKVAKWGVIPAKVHLQRLWALWLHLLDFRVTAVKPPTLPPSPPRSFTFCVCRGSGNQRGWLVGGAGREMRE